MQNTGSGQHAFKVSSVDITKTTSGYELLLIRIKGNGENPCNIFLKTGGQLC
jgi:hypothetical protein